MSAITTQTSPLVRWLDQPRADRELRFADDDQFIAISYDEFAVRCRRAAARLLDAGCRPGDGVVLVQPSSPTFVAALFGAFALGLTPTPVAPPGFFQDAEAYDRHLHNILDLACPAAVVVAAETHGVVERALSARGLHAPIVDVEAGDSEVDLALPAHVSLLQFTSGSSGAAHGVRLTGGAVEANVAQIAYGLKYTPEEPMATWLPLYHDMGLVSGLLLAVGGQGTLTIFRPDQFLRNPARWVRCFDRGNATVTTTPPFGLSFVAKRVSHEDLRGVDLSGWRAAVVGAERIDPEQLDAFMALGAPHGLRRAVLTPAYGLAEATLAVTIADTETEPEAIELDWEALAPGEPVAITRRGWPSGRDASTWLVGCGPPLPGTSVTVLGVDGEPLDEGTLGEIAVVGPSVAAGYEGSSEARSTRFAGGRLNTGDAGFMLDGQLFVIGRMGDALSIRGRSIYAEDLEARLKEVGGVAKERSVAFTGPQEAVAVVEASPGDWAAEVGDALARFVGHRAAVTVIAADRGQIARTSSGKPRRKEMWRRHIQNEIRGEVVTRRAARDQSSPQREPEEA